MKHLTIISLLGTGVGEGWWWWQRWDLYGGKNKWSSAVDFQNLPIREYARKEEKNKRIYNTKIIVEKQQMSHRTHGFYYFQKAFLTAYNKINAIQRQVLRAIQKEEKKKNSWWVRFPHLSICTISEFYTTEVKRKNKWIREFSMLRKHTNSWGKTCSLGPNFWDESVMKIFL